MNHTIKTHRQTFRGALDAVRKEIIRDQCEISDGKIEDHEDRILGYCHENVIGTCQELSSRGYHPRFVWGAVSYDRTEYTPDSIEEAEKNGMVHFWTEVDVAGETFILDPAQETDEEMGSPLVTTQLPKEYIRLPDSRFVYHKDVHHRNLRNREGYEALVEYGYLD